MGKIYCIMGKSSTGKDTLFKKILGDESLALKTIVPYTTRPARAGEKNGVEYFFCDEEKVEDNGQHAGEDADETRGKRITGGAQHSGIGAHGHDEGQGSRPYCKIG